MEKRLFFNTLIIALLALTGCKSDQPEAKPQETLTSGLIHVSADESFKPIIDSQVKVFEALHPDATIVVHYKPEADCLRDLYVDSIRMVIVTRGLSDPEIDDFKKSLTYSPAFGIMAYDAVAIIVNNKTPDSLFTLGDLRSIAKGISSSPYKLLLDGKTSTSSVRFLTDSLLKGASIKGRVEGAETSEKVIDYVANHTDAIGMVGVSWVGNPKDADQSTFREDIKVAALECRDCKGGPHVKPYQANLYLGRYPMIRPLYYIVKENFDGLGSGFKNFLTLEKGQRIFKRAFLLPAKMSFRVQNMDISN